MMVSVEHLFSKTNRVFKTRISANSASSIRHEDFRFMVNWIRRRAAFDTWPVGGVYLTHWRATALRRSCRAWSRAQWPMHAVC